MPMIEVDGHWEVADKGDSGKPVFAKRSFGKGRIVLLAVQDQTVWPFAQTEGSPAQVALAMPARNPLFFTLAPVT